MVFRIAHQVVRIAGSRAQRRSRGDPHPPHAFSVDWVAEPGDRPQMLFSRREGTPCSSPSSAGGDACRKLTGPIPREHPMRAPAESPSARRPHVPAAVVRGPGSQDRASGGVIYVPSRAPDIVGRSASLLKKTRIAKVTEVN